ncbi:MAG: transglycosylase SLT domain-containing protein [Dongiaceae bacterium]
MILFASLALGAGEAVARDNWGSDIFPSPFAQAIQAQRYNDAWKWASKANQPLLASYALWQDLQRPEANYDFAVYRRFLHDHKHWPNIKIIAEMAEFRLPLQYTPQEVVAYFEEFPPQAGASRLRLANARRALGNNEEADALIKEAWRKDVFNAANEKFFLDVYGKALSKEDGMARLDTRLDQNDEASAMRQAKRMGKSWVSYVQARTALAANKTKGVNLYISLPKELQQRPALLLDYLKYLRLHDRDTMARQILQQWPKKVTNPEAWWREQEIQSRRALRKGDAALAYKTARRVHPQYSNLIRAEQEFLSGWIALRFLEKPEIARAHFSQLYQIANLSISKARATYWLGRSEEALGNQALAQYYYQTASQQPTSFYGQLARQKMDMPPSFTVTALPEPGYGQKQGFAARDTVQLIQALYAMGLNDKIDPFLRQLLTEAQSGEDFWLLADTAKRLKRPSMIVAVSRLSAQRGFYLLEDGYPLIANSSSDILEPALVHALIRQESSFDETAVSKAGALGLMQLMPSTAKSVAKQQTLAFHPKWLVEKPELNIKIGSHYLKERLQQFAGNYAISLAAYNAGPARVRGWLAEWGDPRDGRIDPVDWMESIPAAETRNYVQRVLENLVVYRYRLANGNAPPPASSFAQAEPTP